ncbi:MAG: hypothetical protein ACRCZQ_08120 [Bacteroidales bacterium]
MIELQDLQNKVYWNKKCIGFDYNLYYHDRSEPVEIRFRKPSDESKKNIWTVCMVLSEELNNNNQQVYKFQFEVPSKKAPLHLVAATGLRYLKLVLAEELEVKILIEYSIGQVISGL